MYFGKKTGGGPVTGLTTLSPDYACDHLFKRASPAHAPLEHLLFAKYAASPRGVATQSIQGAPEGARTRCESRLSR